MHVNYICHITTTCTFYIELFVQFSVSVFNIPFGVSLCLGVIVKQMVLRHKIATLGCYVHGHAWVSVLKWSGFEKLWHLDSPASCI